MQDKNASRSKMRRNRIGHLAGTVRTYTRMLIKQRFGRRRSSSKWGDPSTMLLWPTGEV